MNRRYPDAAHHPVPGRSVLALPPGIAGDPKLLLAGSGAGTQALSYCLSEFRVLAGFIRHDLRLAGDRPAGTILLAGIGHDRWHFVGRACSAFGHHGVEPAALTGGGLCAGAAFGRDGDAWRGDDQPVGVEPAGHPVLAHCHPQLEQFFHWRRRQRPFRERQRSDAEPGDRQFAVCHRRHADRDGLLSTAL